MLALSACQTWRGRPVPEPGAQQVPPTVRVTLADGGTAVVWHATLERDSLIGLVGQHPGTRTRFAVPLQQVQRMEGRGPAFLATVAFATVATIAAAYAILFTLGPST
jgi:hypothetical protein